MAHYKIKNIHPLPEYMQVYAEYLEDDGSTLYVPVFFAGMVQYENDDELYPAFFTTDECGVFDLPDDASNFSKITIFDKRPSEKVVARRSSHRTKTEETPKPAQAPELLSIRQASEKTGLSYMALRNMIRENKITFIKCGRKYLINFTSLAKYLNTGGRL